MTNPFSLFHNAVFGNIQRGLHSWFPGLFARVTFASVLLMYFINSAKTKVGEGWEGFFHDATQVPLFPYQIIVYAGTYAEFILPVLIVIGLFTRIAAVGMIVFVIVQTYVDITAHAVDEKTIGSFFDRLPDAVIADQRLLWVFLLAYLFIYGAGKISLDQFFAPKKRSRRRRSEF